MDPLSSQNEEGYSAELQVQVVDFIRNIHPEDDRDPYAMAELLFNVPEFESKKWVRQVSSQRITYAVEVNYQDTEHNLENITESLKLIKQSMQKLEKYNQLLIQKWKKKRKK